MAGKITISTLNNDTGVLATQNGMTGIAKAWVNFYGVGTATVNASFNISSVTRNGTGDYTINFTTAMPNANYAVSFGGTSNGGDAGRSTYGILASGGITTAPTTMTTTSLRFIGGGKYSETATSDFYTITAIVVGA